jgi:hypothetical protein
MPTVGWGVPFGPPTVKNVPETVAMCGCALGVELQEPAKAAAVSNTVDMRPSLLILIAPPLAKSD